MIRTSAAIGLALVICLAPVATRAQKRKPSRPAPKPAAPAAAPAVPLLTYDEVVELYKHNPASKALEDKKTRIFTTPFVSNSAAERGVRPRTVDVPGLGRSVRVAFWNIERGIEFDAIVAAFKGPEEIARYVDTANITRDSEDWKRIMQQSETLASADVVILNELDWGMKRSGYRNVPADLAAALDMNYAYGVEFIECDPLSTGTETFDGVDPAQREELIANNQVDRARFRGMHGSAILSRYRLDNVKITRLPKDPISTGTRRSKPPNRRSAPSWRPTSPSTSRDFAECTGRRSSCLHRLEERRIHSAPQGHDWYRAELQGPSKLETSVLPLKRFFDNPSARFDAADGCS